ANLGSTHHQRTLQHAADDLRYYLPHDVTGRGREYDIGSLHGLHRIRVRSQPLRETASRQEQRVLLLPVDGLHHLGLESPEADREALASEEVGECGAPASSP